MRPSLPFAVIVLVAVCAVVALVGVSGIAADSGSKPPATETTILEQGPFQGSPIGG